MGTHHHPGATAFDGFQFGLALFALDLAGQPGHLDTQRYKPLAEILVVLLCQ